MKKFSYLISTILLLSLLTACVNDESILKTNEIETIVAGTLSAIPTSFPTALPTITVTLNPTNTVEPLNAYRNSNFGFEFLYPIDITYIEWEPVQDLIFSMDLTTMEDKINGTSQPPSVFINVFSNTERLSLSEWVKFHTSSEKLETSVVRFDKTYALQELTIDNHHAVIFQADHIMLGTLPRLLIENSEQIISISFITNGFEPAPIRDRFLMVASSFKFGVSTDNLTINQNLKSELENILSSFSQ